MEAVFMCGEDSYTKSLEAAARHRQSGIFQIREGYRRRQLIVFPREGDAEGLRAGIHKTLQPVVRVAEHRDRVPGLSSSALRERLGTQPQHPPPAEELHPAVWELMRKFDRAAAVQAPAQAQEAREYYSVREVRPEDKRGDSQTVRMRNFHNFAKSVLIARHVSELRQQMLDVGDEGPVPISVLDLCCGRGGDLKKFANCGVTEYCGADVSGPSLEELAARVESLARNAPRAKHGALGQGLALKEVSLVRTDCWQVRLAPALDAGGAHHATARLPGLNQAWFHLTSSQMACHYAFESRESADMMLRNASERLCSGGYFICTIPDASQIVAVLQQAVKSLGNMAFGNAVFKVEFDHFQWSKLVDRLELWSDSQFVREMESPEEDMFGITYKFTLVDAVEGISEPLVHFGLLRGLARRHGLVLHEGPVNLAHFIANAANATEGMDCPEIKAELGRLRRIYFYKGGMDCSVASGFYSVCVFRKEEQHHHNQEGPHPVTGSTGLTGKQLVTHLRELRCLEGDVRRLPSGSHDIFYA